MTYPKLSAVPFIDFDNVVTRSASARISVVDLVNGEDIEVGGYFRDVLRGSKGGMIFVLRGGWLIVNASFDGFVETIRKIKAMFEGDVKIKIGEFELDGVVVRVFKERKFAIVEPKHLSFSIVVLYTRKEIENTGLELIGEVSGARVYAGCSRTRRISGNVWFSVEFRNGMWSVRQTKTPEEMESVRDEDVIKVVWSGSKELMELKNDVEMGKISRFIVTGEGGVLCYSSFFGVDFVPGRLPSEEELLRCSRFYTIVILRKRLVFDRGVMDEYEIYNGGRKYRIVGGALLRFKPFDIRRRHFISTYAKRVLPAVKVECRGSEDVLCYARSFFEVLPRVCELVSKVRTRKSVVVADELEAVAELVYERFPRRKLRLVREYMKVFERVKELADDAKLYVVFNPHVINYDFRYAKVPGFIVSKDGRVSLLTRKTVPMSAVVMKGGEFVNEYIEAFKLRRLLRFEYASLSKKAEMLYEDIERIRSVVGDLSYVRHSEAVSVVREWALKQELSDNVVAVLFSYVNRARKAKYHGFYGWSEEWASKVEAAVNTIIGLIKSGSSSDVVRQYPAIVDVLRVAVLYEIKGRGYSPRLGVMFMGNPKEIISSVVRTVKKIGGRLLALYTELTDSADVVDAAVVEEASGRIRALLDLMREKQ